MAPPREIVSDRVALTQNSWTQVLPARRRASLTLKHINAIGSDAIRVSFARNPWVVTFGSGDHVACDGVSTNAAFLRTTTGEIVAYIKLASSAAARTIFSVSDTNANEGMSFGLTTADKLTATLRTAAEVKWTLTCLDALTEGVWYAVKLIHNGVAPVIVVDGQPPVQTFSVTTDKTAWIPALANLDNARIGGLSINSAGEAAQFVGSMQGMTVLTGIGQPRENLAQWPMTEGTGTSLADATDNGLTGTFGAATAAPSWGDLEYGDEYDAKGGYAWNKSEEPPQGPVWAYTVGASLYLGYTERRRA